MYEDIYSKLKDEYGIEVKDYVFERDHVKEPYKRWIDKLSKNDLYYLYITLNLPRYDVAKILGVSETILKRTLRKYGVVKSVENMASNREKTILKRYGVDHYSKVNGFKEKVENTKLRKYGDKNYNNREKANKTCNEKYGVSHYMLVPEFIEKFKKTNINRYGVPYPMQSKEIKEKLKNVMLDKYGIDNSMKLEKTVTKIHDSKLKNGTSSSSRDEEKINELLNIKFSIVKRQYRSEKYPFDCDFYIPDLDLYIEYQGFWSHGPQECHEPFDENNKKHLEILKLWKTKNSIQYDKAIYVWTVRDPLKRKIVQENSLNWIEFFTMREFYDWYNKIT